LSLFCLVSPKNLKLDRKPANNQAMLLTQDDLGEMLSLVPSAVKALITTREIPYAAIIDGMMYFCPDAVIAWAKTRPNLTAGNARRIEGFKERLEAEAPDAAKDLREFGKRFAERKPPKYYYLVKYPHKKLVYTWYVKYFDKGILVPSKWATGTNDKDAAAAFAVRNREAILGSYYARKAKKPASLYRLLKNYYEKDSELLQADAKRGRTLCDKRRRACLNVIKKKFIPFIKKNGARAIEDIDTAMLARFQNHLLKTLVAKSVNDHVSAVRMVFNHLVTTGYAKSNSFAGLPSIRKGESKATGCYEVGKVKGAFDREWENPAHRLLCLLIYSTGMRNGEINRLRLGDLVEMDGVTFVDIKKSKTPNGERKVPLHPFVRERLIEYAGGRDAVFPQVGKTFEKLCSAANVALGERLGHARETLKGQNIRFYSGRHFWKTLMNSENLGESAEKLLMGHKVHGDIANTYNHLDKVGAEKMAKVAREVFAALDRCLFD